MKYYTDYQITWDYELSENIDKKYLKIIKDFLKEIKKYIKHEIIKNIIVTPIILNDGALGVYCDGTKQYIGIDIDNIINESKKWNVDFIIQIKITILHEIAHAIQEFYEKEYNEDEAEQFARDYIEYRIISQPIENKRDKIFQQTP